jgi:DNA-directed RNA polymerase I subunit RPA49
MAGLVEKGKKRKKHTDGSLRPSKKVAVDGDRNIKISLQKEDKWAPIIGMQTTLKDLPESSTTWNWTPANSFPASTPGVSIPSSIPLKPYTKPRSEVQTNGRGPLATTELLLHSNAHSKLEYTAREEQETGGPNALLKHYVGVYDPETGKLEVMEARRMVVRGVVRAHQATADEDTPTVSTDTIRLVETVLMRPLQNVREQRNDLGRAFGTKKAKKALASITENAISRGNDPGKTDASTQAMIAAMSKAAEGMATREELNAQADASKPRPKANLSATDIKDVYTVDSLIGMEIFKAVPVLEWQQAIKAKKEIVVSSQYVAHRINKCASSTEKLRILRYLLLLIEIHKGSIAKFGRGKMLPKRDDMKKIAGGMPEPVVESARRQFSSDGYVSKYQSDLLTTHICALACLVDNYTVDMYDLQLDLRMELKPMSQFFHEIGAKTTALPEGYRKELGLDKAGAAQRKLARLKLPLDFPKIPFARAPRR